MPLPSSQRVLRLEKQFLWLSLLLVGHFFIRIRHQNSIQSNNPCLTRVTRCAVPASRYSRTNVVATTDPVTDWNDTALLLLLVLVLGLIKLLHHYQSRVSQSFVRSHTKAPTTTRLECLAAAAAAVAASPPRARDQIHHQSSPPRGYYYLSSQLHWSPWFLFNGAHLLLPAIHSPQFIACPRGNNCLLRWCGWGYDYYTMIVNMCVTAPKSGWWCYPQRIGCNRWSQVHNNNNNNNTIITDIHDHGRSHTGIVWG